MINMTTEEFHTALYALVDSSHTVIINDGTTDGISLINGKINVHNIKITSERFYMDDGTNKLLALRYADLTGVDVSSVTDLHQCFTDFHYGMFADIVISNWDTSNVTNMSQMFYAYRGTSLDTRGLDTQNVTDMSRMFEKCYANIINLSTFDTSSVTNDTDMFLDCTTTRIVVNKDKWTLDTSSGVFYNYNGKVYIGDTEIMTKANSDRDIATSLNSALANYDNFVNDLVFSLVTSGNTSGTASTFTFTKTIPRTNQYVDGMTCKLMFTSALQSSVAIDEVLIKVNNLEAKPIKVMRNNTLVNMTSSEMQSGAEYSSTYKHRWCDAYTKLELTYSSSANAWIANGSDVVMSYGSANEYYTKYANGLIKQGKTYRGWTRHTETFFLVYVNIPLTNISVGFDLESAWNSRDIGYYNVTTKSLNITFSNYVGTGASFEVIGY